MDQQAGELPKAVGPKVMPANRLGEREGCSLLVWFGEVIPHNEPHRETLADFLIDEAIRVEADERPLLHDALQRFPDLIC
jgi:hypothetical protein